MLTNTKTFGPQRCLGGSAHPRLGLFVSGGGRSARRHFYPNTGRAAWYSFSLQSNLFPVFAWWFLAWQKALTLALNKPCCSAHKGAWSRCRSGCAKCCVEPLVVLAGLFLGKFSLFFEAFCERIPSIFPSAVHFLLRYVLNLPGFSGTSPRRFPFCLLFAIFVTPPGH